MQENFKGYKARSNNDQCLRFVKKELLDWMESLRGNTDESVLKDLTEIELLQSELNWQLNNVCKVINNSLDKGNSDNFSPEYKENLESISSRINGILK